MRIASRLDRHDFDDLTLLIDLHQTFVRALGNERISVGQPLTAPHLTARNIFKHDFLFRCDLSHSTLGTCKTHQDIAAVKQPGVCALVHGILPLNFSRGRYLEDALCSDIAAKKAMLHFLA